MYAPHAIQPSLPRQCRRTLFTTTTSPDALASLDGRPYNWSLTITRNVYQITEYVSGMEDAAGAAEDWWWWEFEPGEWCGDACRTLKELYGLELELKV